jgi:hypothetical protein
MKIIQTKNMYMDTYQNSVVFNIPAFSNIQNFFIENNQLYIIYESDTAYVENNKIINVKIVKGLSLNEANDFYKYWGTIKTDSSTLSSNTGSSSLSSINLNIQLMNITTHVHLFILETKPVEEIRDDKLNTLL